MKCHELRVLIIEDEVQMRRFLRASLQAHGYTPIEAATGGQGVAYASTTEVDIVLLDLGLPDLDGTDVARRLRECTPAPVIVLSARTDVDDKIGALDAGATDYLTKPFDVAELLARIRAARRQVSPPTRDKTVSIFMAGHLRIDWNAGVVLVRDQEVHLTPIEYKLLQVLIENVGRVMTHQQLLKGVWGTRYTTRAQYLHVYIGRLRAKIDVDPDRVKLLVTEPGVGYRFRTSDPALAVP